MEGRKGGRGNQAAFDSGSTQFARCISRRIKNGRLFVYGFLANYSGEVMKVFC